MAPAVAKVLSIASAYFKVAATRMPPKAPVEMLYCALSVVYERKRQTEFVYVGGGGGSSVALRNSMT